jgi:hypothetical protein
MEFYPAHPLREIVGGGSNAAPALAGANNDAWLRGQQDRAVTCLWNGGALDSSSSTPFLTLQRWMHQYGREDPRCTQLALLLVLEEILLSSQTAPGATTHAPRLAWGHLETAWRDLLDPDSFLHHISEEAKLLHESNTIFASPREDRGASLWMLGQRLYGALCCPGTVDATAEPPRKRMRKTANESTAWQALLWMWLAQVTCRQKGGDESALTLEKKDALVGRWGPRTSCWDVEGEEALWWLGLDRLLLKEAAVDSVQAWLEAMPSG